MSYSIFILWFLVLIGRPQDYFSSLQSFRPALLLTLLTVLATVLSGKFPRQNILKNYESKIYMFFYIFMIIGIPFAYHRRFAFNFIFMAYIVNIFFYYMFITYVNSIDRMKNIIFVILLCNLFYSGFSLLFGSSIQGRFYTYGEMFDPNDIACVTLSLLPIGIYFIIYRKSLLKKIGAIISIPASIILVLFTGSRAGLIALGISLFLLFVNFRRHIKLRYAVAVALVLIIAFPSFSRHINFDRLRTLENIYGDYNVTAETGRYHIWQRGYHLFLNNPITGVGANCFPMAIGYLRERTRVQPVWQAAHNSYIQVAVETGLLGFIPYIFLIIFSLKNFHSIRRVNQSFKNIEEFQVMAGLFQVGYIALLVNMLFLSQGYSFLLTMYFALSVSLKNLVNDETEHKFAFQEKSDKAYFPLNA